MDRVALDVHAEDVRGLGLGVSRIVGDLHAAGLAAATGLDLRLDHDAAAELLGDRARFVWGGSDLAGRHRDAVLREEFLRLMFEEVHEEATLSAHAECTLRRARNAAYRHCRALPSLMRPMSSLPAARRLRSRVARPRHRRRLALASGTSLGGKPAPASPGYTVQTLHFTVTRRARQLDHLRRRR